MFTHRIVKSNKEFLRLILFLMIIIQDQQILGLIYFIKLCLITYTLVCKEWIWKLFYKMNKKIFFNLIILYKQIYSKLNYFIRMNEIFDAPLLCFLNQSRCGSYLSRK